jgi:hypothetical protein
MKVLKLVIGIMLIPVAYALFVLDRMVMGMFFPHYAHPTFILWCDVKYSTLALLRMIFISLVIGISYWIFA